MTTLKNISPTVLNLQNIENTLNISQWTIQMFQVSKQA
jgi:hypothetical protein